MSLIYKGKIVTGSMFINDGLISDKNTWSSEKIEEKLNIGLAVINDENSSTDEVYSSSKVDSLIGDLTTLETTEKSNIIDAINEAKVSGGTKIDDTTSSETSVYSSQKMDSLIPYTFSYSNGILDIKTR